MPENDEYRINGKENFGDILTPYLVEKLSGLRPTHFEPTFVGAKYIVHSIMTGSIIEEAINNTIVWGSGIISKNEKIRGGDFRSVRGPETIKRLRELGLKAPEAIGDPAILLPLIYTPSATKKYKIGIVPHYVDYKAINEKYKDHPDVIIINLITDNIENVIENICSCERIISTSLHGIIVANIYKIPTIWLKFSNKLVGDDVKFYDYFHSVKLYDLKFINEDKLQLNFIDDNAYFLPDDDIVKKIQRDLLLSYPYKIKNKFLVETFL